METIKIMKSEEMHNLIEDNLATWKQFIGACVYQNKADEKVMIKLPCKLTLQSGMEVNAITFVKRVFKNIFFLRIALKWLRK